jgi:hypothetical protein
MHNYVLTEKKIKKRTLHRTPHCRQPAAKAHTQRLEAAGMRQCNRSATSKKGIRSLIKQKEVIENKIYQKHLK